MRLSLTFLLVIVVFLGGCSPTSGELKRRTRARGARLMIAITHYAAKNHEKYPEKLEELIPFFKSEKEFRIAMTHPVTGAVPAWEYVRPAETIMAVRNPSAVPVLYELVAGKRVEKGQGFIGYADEHMEPELGSPLTKEDMALPE